MNLKERVKQASGPSRNRLMNDKSSQSRIVGNITPRMHMDVRNTRMHQNNENFAVDEEDSVHVEDMRDVSNNQSRSNPFDNASSDDFDCGQEVDQPGQAKDQMNRYNNGRVSGDNYNGDLNATVVHSATRENNST